MLDKFSTNFVFRVPERNISRLTDFYCEFSVKSRQYVSRSIEERSRPSKSAGTKDVRVRAPMLVHSPGLELGHLVFRTSKSAGARGDVQNLGGCQAPAAPVLTQALHTFC